MKSAPIHPIHERGQRGRHARWFLAVVFLLQRMADAAAIWFAFLPSNPTLLLRGVAIGSGLWTCVLLVGVWRRLRWARYALTTFNWAYVAFFSFWVLLAWDELQITPSNPYSALLAAAVLYLAANVILLRSRRVRHFAHS